MPNKKLRRSQTNLKMQPIASNHIHCSYISWPSNGQQPQIMSEKFGNVIRTLSAGVMLVIGSSSVKPPFISFLGSLPSKVSCLCKSNMYSACENH